MSTKSTYSRIARRETHSPRSVLAIILAVILILAAAYAVIEIILAIARPKPLLVTPGNAAKGLVGANTIPVWILIVAGIILAIIGIWLIIASFTSGRRARHLIQTDRAVTVIDNEVIASALARHASYAANTDPDNTRVSVTHNRAVVEMTPATGRDVDKSRIQEAVNEQLAAYDVSPKLRSKIDIKKTGKVGA
ncbi:DUF6286 domain-containing protein [Frondihabitans sp. VKM Ac-2883]|uniref:DUF6286 domain-containing protein n=1 Tax=Frondihabitans sp. VKM Ac-2883 TaxID=2783823 RepID=UPI00188D0302|nr:DUF6286 domain-containing protein [Frondihabitans sp. VKM Ac-2883]MBF4577591.1 hypothetical protein [Frondihabitans sp. VKM Ac-2883]